MYESKKDDEYYFITAKRKENLNSQFKSDDTVYLHPKSAFKTGDKVILSSKYGKASFMVKISEDIKEECAFCFTGNKNSNYLTNHKSDEEADSAMFQEVLIRIELS
jgi:predicted molibdopterin-dependent oxidoreductase YjgC